MSLLITMSGCGTLLPGPGYEYFPYHREFSPLPSDRVCRVAVLPFLNDTDLLMANTIVSKTFAAHMLDGGNYLIVQEGDIKKLYEQLRIYPGQAPSLEQYKVIANQVNAQILVTGIIMEAREDPGEHRGVDPVLVMEVQIRDGRNGETLWTVFHKRRGSDYKKTMHFGSLHSISGLSDQMAVEIINLWFEKGLTKCNVS